MIIFKHRRRKEPEFHRFGPSVNESKGTTLAKDEGVRNNSAGNVNSRTTNLRVKCLSWDEMQKRREGDTF